MGLPQGHRAWVPRQNFVSHPFEIEVYMLFMHFILEENSHTKTKQTRKNKDKLTTTTNIYIYIVSVQTSVSCGPQIWPLFYLEYSVQIIPHPWVNGESICKDELNNVSLTFLCFTVWSSALWLEQFLEMWVQVPKQKKGHILCMCCNQMTILWSINTAIFYLTH